MINGKNLKLRSWMMNLSLYNNADISTLSNVRIAIFGAGAVGSYVAYKLSNAGISYDIIARGERLDILQKYGLNVDAPNDNKSNYKINAVEKLDGLYDVIFLTVKSNDTINVSTIIKPHLKDSGVVVSLQNGVDNPKLIATVIDADKVVVSVVYVTAVSKNFNQLKYYSEAKIIYDYFKTGNKTNNVDNTDQDVVDNKSNLEILNNIFNCAGISSKHSKDIVKDQWRKLLFNAVSNPLTALFGYTYGRFLEDKTAVILAKKIFDEALFAAKLLDIYFDVDEFDKILAGMGGVPSFKSSMLQDIEANRKPELDAILGIIVDVFKSNGLTATSIEMLVDIMKVKYGGYFQSSPRLAADLVAYRGREVLLIERMNEPYGYAIPGGFVDLGESVEDAAVRELSEETNIDVKKEDISLIGVYSEPSRDSRGHTVSVIYSCDITGREVEAKGRDDALSADFFDIDNLPEKLAFDHRKVLNDFRKQKGL